MQFVDLNSQFNRIKPDLMSRITKVLENQDFIMGSEIAELEKVLAERAGVKHVLTCGSGTDALVIPLMAYNLAKDDAVFVPSFTFFASAEAITLAGGTPVFVDVDANTFNISISSLLAAIKMVNKAGDLQPRGIIAVDLFGCPADYESLQDVADEYGLFIIEDAAQSLGAEYLGRKAGSFGNVAATSFYPAKPLGCYGDGGAILTNDDQLADLCASIRIHGQGVDKYDNVRIGINGRFDTIQAAVVLAKLNVFDDELVARNKVAKAYSEGLKNLIKIPEIPDGYSSVWAQYTLTAASNDARTRILDALHARGIPTAIYYPIPIHLATAYQGLGYKPGDLLVSEKLAQTVFSIPICGYLEEQDVQMIIDAVMAALNS